MRMFNKTLIILIVILSCCSAKTEYSVPKADKVSKLFRIVEDKMEAHYKYIEKNRIFEDPIGRAIHFFEVVRTVAPQLLTNTKLYKDEMLSLLTDSTFQKNDFTDDDVVYILYNLPIGDYANLLNHILTLYKSGDIDYYIFKLFIFQDDFVSNSIYKNSKNEKTQTVLEKLLEDNNLILKAELKNKRFREAILGLKNDVIWGEEDENGPVSILDTLKIGQ